MHNVLATLDGHPILLAQPDTQAGEAGTTDPAGETPGGETGGGGGIFGGMWLPLILGMMVLWIFLLGGGSRKQKKKQQAMLASMSKGSKIVTIGGIKGSVVEVREDEVVVKVDENNNTRMKFSRDAIRTVVDDSPPSKEKEKDKDDKETKDGK